jgi:hypothetical protein
MTDLGTIGGVIGQSQALGINHRGQVSSPARRRWRLLWKARPA